MFTYIFPLSFLVINLYISDLLSRITVRALKYKSPQLPSLPPPGNHFYTLRFNDFNDV